MPLASHARPPEVGSCKLFVRKEDGVCRGTARCEEHWWKLLWVTGLGQITAGLGPWRARICQNSAQTQPLV